MSTEEKHSIQDPYCDPIEMQLKLERLADFCKEKKKKTD
jgi:hypothetical protein